MSQQHTAVCECGCTESCEYESQFVCTECGRTVSDVQLQHFTGDAGVDMLEQGWSYVSASTDGSHLCAPLSKRRPARLSGLKAKVEYLANVLTMPQCVLDEAVATVDALCGRTFQNDSDGARSCVALFVACRVQKYPMTLRNICQWMRVGLPEASGCLRRYSSVTKVPCPPLQAKDLIARCVHQYAAANKLSKSVTTSVLKLANRLLSFSSRHIAGSAELWQASACILLALAVAADTKPSTQIGAALNLGIDHKSVLQRHLPELVSALRAHAAHSPGVSIPSVSLPLDSSTAARAAEPAPLAQLTQGPSSSGPASHTDAQPDHCQAASPPSPLPLLRQADQALQDHTHGAPESSGTRAPTILPAELSQYPKLSQQQPPSTAQPVATAVLADRGCSATCAPSVIPPVALNRRMKRHADENAWAVAFSKPPSKVPRKKVIASKRRGVLNDVWKGGVEGEAPGRQLGSGVPGCSLTLSVVQAVLDVDECLAMCIPS